MQISVIMPVHNAGHYLADAVNSILTQQGVELELVIIDDHSSDAAITRLPADSRISLVESPQRGIVAALNHGLENSKYPLIARMDGDDVAAPNRLICQLELLIAQPEIDVVGSKVNIFSDQGKLGKGYQLYQNWINQQCSPQQIADNFFVESCIPHPSALFRRSLIEEIGPYQDCPWPEDYDLWCRALVAGKRFGKPKQEALLHWRDHPQRTSRVEQRYVKQRFLECKAHYLAQYLSKRATRTAMIWGTGPTGLKMHDLLQQHGIEISGFIDVNPKLAGRQKRDKPVHIISQHPQPQELAHLDSLILSAVSARGARQKICAALDASGRTAGQDYICVA